MAQLLKKRGDSLIMITRTHHWPLSQIKRIQRAHSHPVTLMSSSHLHPSLPGCPLHYDFPTDLVIRTKSYNFTLFIYSIFLVGSEFPSSPESRRHHFLSQFYFNQCWGRESLHFLAHSWRQNLDHFCTARPNGGRGSNPLILRTDARRETRSEAMKLFTWSCLDSSE